MRKKGSSKIKTIVTISRIELRDCHKSTELALTSVGTWKFSTRFIKRLIENLPVEMSSGFETFKVLTYNGEDTDKWREFSAKFMRYADMQDLSVAYLEGFKIPEGKEKLAEDDERKEKKAKALLTASLTSDAFAVIDDVTLTTAKEMWEALLSEYEPNDQEDLEDLEQQWSTAEFGDENENPKKLFVKLERIRHRMTLVSGEKGYSDVALITHIMKKTPPIYDALETNLRGQMSSLGLKEVKKRYELEWKAKAKSTSKSDKGVFNLNKKPGNPNKKPWKKFKGNCRHCGKQGHKEKDCFKKKNGEPKVNTAEPGKKVVKCYRCQKEGHIARNCPQKESVDTLFVGNVNFETLGTNQWCFTGLAADLAKTKVSIFDDNSLGDESAADVVENPPVDIADANKNKMDFVNLSDGSLSSKDDSYQELVSRNCQSDSSTETEWEDEDTITEPSYVFEAIPKLSPLKKKRDLGYDSDGDTISAPELMANIKIEDRDDESFEHIMGPSDELDLDIAVVHLDSTTCLNPSPSNVATELLTEEELRAIFGEISEDMSVEFHPINVKVEDMEEDEVANEFEINTINVYCEDIYIGNIVNGEFVNYLMDTGAMTHVENKKERMSSPKPTSVNLHVGEGTEVPCDGGVGNLYIQPKGHDSVIKLEETYCATKMKKPIISCGKLLEKGWKIEINEVGMNLKYERDDGYKLEVLCERGADGLYYMSAKPVKESLVYNNELSEQGGGENQWKDCEEEIDDSGNLKNKPRAPRPKVMDINEAHDKFGHKGEHLLRKTCKTLGIKLTGELKTCEGCCLAKAKQKSVSKTTNEVADKPGKRLFVDGSGPYSVGLNGVRYMVVVVDDHTRKGFVGFCKQKSQYGKYLHGLIDKLKGMELKIEFLRCDNAGENQKGFEKLCEENGITIENTAPDTPQQNGVAERRISLLIQRANAAMRHAQLTNEARELLWPEAVDCMNDLENITCTTLHDKCADELFTGKPPKIYPYLVEWGRIGFVTIRQKFKSKWKEHSFKAAMVGYAKNHSGDTYRMYNPKTKKVIESRDIKWADFNRPDPYRGVPIFQEDPDLLNLQPGFDDKENVTGLIDEAPHVIPDIPEPVPLDTVAGRMVEDATEPVADKDKSEDAEVEASKQKALRVERELRRLDTSYNPVQHHQTMSKATLIEEDKPTGDEISKELHFVFNTALSSDPGEPKTYKAAMEGPESDQWKVSYAAEIMNFIKRGSWKKVPRENARKLGKTIIKVKPVFKKKNEQDGSIRFKSRIVTKGFQQIPGVDFTESFSPVATDTSIRTGLILVCDKQEEDWTCEVIDVEAAFLEGKIESPTFIEWPDGMVEFGFITEEERELYCIQLTKSMYGNVNAALIWFKTYENYLTKQMGMEQCRSDPCVFYLKENDKVSLVTMIFVDDTTLYGLKEKIEWFKKKLKERFNISDLGRLRKHLGVWYEWKMGKDGIEIEATMDQLVESIIQAYETHTNSEVKEYSTPGKPGDCLAKNTDDESTDPEQYRSIVGKIMYLVTKLFPEGANAARELAKHFANPGKEHWEAVERYVGYLKRNRNEIKLTYRKPREIRALATVDSNYATNKEDRRSITGAIFTVGGIITNWISKTQPVVTLASTDAEYYALTTAAQEVIFTQQLLSEISQPILPGILLEDNTGAIFLVKNKQVSSRTKHISIRQHFIRERVADGEIVVKYTRSENNEGDIATKNNPEAIHMKHAQNIRDGKIYAWRNWNEIIRDINEMSECSEGGCYEL